MSNTEELVARLRGAETTLGESLCFGLVGEAADMIEAQAAELAENHLNLLAASDVIEDLRTENEALRKQVETYKQLIREQWAQPELAASQAREAKLREELKRIGMGEAKNGCIASTGDLIDMAYEALALPQDTTALDELLAKERERCAFLAEGLDDTSIVDVIAAAIRSLK